MSERTEYREIGDGFDRSAPRYDREMHDNPAMRAMRQVSLDTLTQVFSPGQRVLEIGCGTGEEAVALGQRGVRVLATDLSPVMLEVTQRKVAAAGLEHVVETQRLAAGELGLLAEEVGPGAFEGAYSSFGPLNGETDLARVRDALALLLLPQSRVVVSVMNRFCLFETAWYLAHGRLRQAVRRWGGQTWATVSSELALRVPTWYHTPHAFARSMAPDLQRESCRALPWLLPPPFAGHLWTRFPRSMARAARWEERLASRWPFRALGDHFLMVLRRT